VKKKMSFRCPLLVYETFVTDPDLDLNAPFRDSSHATPVLQQSQQLKMTVEEQQQGLDLSAQIISVDELQNHGINASDITKLKVNGISSVSVCHDMTNVVCFPPLTYLYLVSAIYNQKKLVEDQRVQ
jgi:hypothetical protein